MTTTIQRNVDSSVELLEDAEEDLMARAFLYEHPPSFREGVEASMEAVRALLAGVRPVRVPIG